jgi:hypothetical protein
MLPAENERHVSLGRAGVLPLCYGRLTALLPRWGRRRDLDLPGRVAVSATAERLQRWTALSDRATVIITLLRLLPLPAASLSITPT